MSELSLSSILEIFFKTLLDSRTLILLVLEVLIILLSFGFKRFISKKVVNITCILASFVIFTIYGSSYIDTFKIFLDNVSTRLVEMIYFPTTLEIISVLIVSFIILIVTYLKKSSKIFKLINTSLALSITFIFLCMIEYMNTNSINFDEFSVFTNPVLMALNEFAVGLFISWLFGLIVYKLDKFIISHINITELDSIDSLELPKLKIESDELIELPKLKASL